jgi:hypothetical protein
MFCIHASASTCGARPFARNATTATACRAADGNALAAGDRADQDATVPNTRPISARLREAAAIGDGQVEVDWSGYGQDRQEHDDARTDGGEGPGRRSSARPRGSG